MKIRYTNYTRVPVIYNIVVITIDNKIVITWDWDWLQNCEYPTLNFSSDPSNCDAPIGCEGNVPEHIAKISDCEKFPSSRELSIKSSTRENLPEKL